MGSLRLGFALICVVGCTGRVGDPLPLPAGAGPSGPTGSTGGPNTPPPPPPPLVCPDPSPQPLRRLTHQEYRNTLVDLFPEVDPSTLRLVSDPYAGYYDTNLAALAVSSNLVLDYHGNARAIGAQLRPNFGARVTCDRAQGQSCLRETVAQLGRRILRRPLSAAELDSYTGLYASGPTAGDLDTSLQVALQTLLESPDFLYRPELGTPGPDPVLAPYERATRLSYLLWASTPDDLLLDAAEAGQLETDAQLSAQVDRLLTDPKAQRGILRFTDQWLKVRALNTAGKDPSENFAEVRPAVVESLGRFVWSVFQRDGTMEELLTAPRAFVDEHTAPIFGVTPPAPGTWAEVNVDPRERAGIVTHPAFLAGHGYPGYPSPVLRGVFVLERYLCNPPRPPPPGVIQSPPPTNDNGRLLSNREGYDRVTLLAGETCAACHTTINPLGFAFEGYDTMGRFRTMDAGRPVDASGDVLGFRFNDGVELARQLGQSGQVARCLSKHWVEYAVADSALADDLCFRRDVELAFEAAGRRLPALIKAIALHPKFARPAIIQE
jgi:hypothetical protein